MPVLTLCSDGWCFSFGSEHRGLNDLQVKHWFVFSAMSFYGLPESKVNIYQSHRQHKGALSQSEQEGACNVRLIIWCICLFSQFWMQRCEADLCHGLLREEENCTLACVSRLKSSMRFGANEQMLPLLFVPGDFTCTSIIHQHDDALPCDWLSANGMRDGKAHNHFNLVPSSTQQHHTLYKRFKLSWLSKVSKAKMLRQNKKNPRFFFQMYLLYVYKAQIFLQISLCFPTHRAIFCCSR